LKYRLKHSYQEDIKTAKNNAYTAYLKTNSFKPTAIWKVVKENTNLLRNKSPTNNLNITPECFNQYFTHIASNIVNNLPEPKTTFDSFINSYAMRLTFPSDTYSFSPITQIELRDLTDKIKNKNSLDYHNMNLKIIKSVMNLIISPLTKLFNFSIRDSVFPKTLKVAKVVPVFKKGSTDELTNYCPISIIPTLSKLLEKALSNRISNFFESHKLFTECQFGFRNEKSTTMSRMENPLIQKMDLLT